MLIHHTTTGEQKEIAIGLWETWQATANPKADGWAPCPPVPEHDPATHRLRWDPAAKDWALDAVPVVLPDAERYQVRSWLRQMAHDHNRPEFHPDNIPALIAAVTPEGLAREDALDRWETVTRIPANHPLVGLIAQQLGLSIPDIWPGILAR